MLQTLRLSVVPFFFYIGDSRVFRALTVARKSTRAVVCEKVSNTHSPGCTWLVDFEKLRRIRKDYIEKFAASVE